MGRCNGDTVHGRAITGGGGGAVWTSGGLKHASKCEPLLGSSTR
jgi:hypothetical protein